MLESTDVSKAGSEFKYSGLCKPQNYDWSEVAHLFEDNAIPDELKEISDPIEYNYILVRLKKDFNEKHRSEYINYMHLQLPYHSRRDEIGGVISQEEWGHFMNRLEGVIEKVKRKRRRIIRRRKKKGIKKLPRKTLFKPVKKPNLAKDPLWKEVFLEPSSDEEDEGSVDDEEELKIDIRDIENKMSYKKNSMGLAEISGIRSAPGQRTSKKSKLKNVTQIEELSLPPIMRPLLYEDFKNDGRQKSSAGKLRTAEMNLKETIDKYPQNKHMLNMRFKDYYYDPFDKEPHKASRIIGPESQT